MYLIYGLKVDGKIVYVGYTNDYDRRKREHRRDVTVDTADFEMIVLFDNIPSRDEALEMEKVFIDVHSTFENGYNKTRGGGRNTEVSESSKGRMSESQRRLVADGTHHLLGGEIQRERNHQHSSDLQRRRVADGTHNFLVEGFQREIQNRRVADGTHHFLGGEIARKNANKRVAEGDHHFLSINRKYFAKKTSRLLGQLSQSKYKIVYKHAVLIPMCYWNGINAVYRHRKLTREGFFDQDIPDTSQSEQLELFVW